MALMVSDELQWFFLVVTGDEFPGLDEDLLRALADVWETAARQLGELARELRAAVATARSGFTGEAEQAFVAVMAPFVDGEHNYLDTAAGFFHQVAEMLRELALAVEYMKYVVILELSMLAAEFKWALTMAVLFGPLSLLWFASRSEMTRKTIQTTIAWIKKKLASFLLIAQQARTLYTEMHWLPRGLLTGMTISMGNQMLVTAGAQKIQFIKGTRTQWNTSYLQDAAVVGAIGGVLAPFVAIPGAIVARKVDRHKEFAHAITHILSESLHEGTTATLATLALTQQFTLNWADFTAGASSGIARTSDKVFGNLVKTTALVTHKTRKTRKTHLDHEQHDTDLDDLHDTIPSAPGNDHSNFGNDGTGWWGRLRGGGLDDDTSSDSGDTSSDDDRLPHRGSHDSDSRSERLHAQVPNPAADHNRPATLGLSHPITEPGDETGATTTRTNTNAVPSRSSTGDTIGALNTTTNPGTAQPSALNGGFTRDGATIPFNTVSGGAIASGGPDLTLAHETSNTSHPEIAPANGYPTDTVSPHVPSPDSAHTAGSPAASSPSPRSDTQFPGNNAPPMVGQPVTTTTSHPLPAGPGTSAKPAGPAPVPTAPARHNTGLRAGPHAGHGEWRAGLPQAPSTVDATRKAVIPGAATPFVSTTGEVTPGASSPRRATPDRGRPDTTALPLVLLTPSSSPPALADTGPSTNPATETVAAHPVAGASASQTETVRRGVDTFTKFEQNQGEIPYSGAGRGPSDSSNGRSSSIDRAVRFPNPVQLYDVVPIVGPYDDRKRTPNVRFSQALTYFSEWYRFQEWYRYKKNEEYPDMLARWRRGMGDRYSGVAKRLLIEGRSPETAGTGAEGLKRVVESIPLENGSHAVVAFGAAGHWRRVVNIVRSTDPLVKISDGKPPTEDLILVDFDEDKVISLTPELISAENVDPGLVQAWIFDAARQPVSLNRVAKPTAVPANTKPLAQTQQVQKPSGPDWLFRNLSQRLARPSRRKEEWQGLRGGNAFPESNTDDIENEFDADPGSGAVSDDELAVGAKTTANNPAPQGAFDRFSSQADAKAVAIYAAFGARFGTVSADRARQALSAATPRRFDELAEVTLAVREAGPGAAAMLTTTSQNGTAQPFTVVNVEGTIHILHADSSGIGVIKPTSEALAYPVSVRAVVRERATEVTAGTAHPPTTGEAATTARPDRAIAEMLPQLEGAEEAFGFHWERGSGLPTPLTPADDGEAGLVDLSLQVLFGGRDAYALAAVQLPGHGARRRMWIVAPDGPSGQRVTITDAKTGRTMEWANFREVSTIDAFVKVSTDVPARQEIQNSAHRVERRHQGTLGQLSHIAMAEYYHQAKKFEKKLPGYLLHDYPGWPQVVQEWDRFATIMSQRAGPSGGSGKKRAADDIHGAIQVVHGINEKTVWADHFPDLPDIPTEVLAGDASMLSYELLTLAREGNRHWGANLDLSLLRLGLLAYGLSLRLGTYHKIMLGGVLTDPERGTKNADPAVRYSDNLGRYYDLFPIEPRALREKLGPFPHEYYAALSDSVLGSTEQRIKVTEAAWTRDRIRLMAERVDPLIPTWDEIVERDHQPSSVREAGDDRLPYTPRRDPEISSKVPPTKPSVLLDFFEDKWSEARPDRENGWTRKKVAAEATAAEHHYRPDDFNKAYEIVSADEYPDTWLAIPRPDALAVLKIAAAALTHDPQADVNGLLTAIATGLAHEPPEPPSAPESKSTTVYRELHLSKARHIARTYDQDQFRQAQTLVEQEVARMAVRGVPAAPRPAPMPMPDIRIRTFWEPEDVRPEGEAHAKFWRQQVAGMVAQAIHDGHDPDEVTRDLVDANLADDTWRIAQPVKPVEPSFVSPLESTEIWWRSGKTADDFRRFANYPRQPPTKNGPLQVPGQVGLGPEIMGEILHDIVVFFNFLHSFITQSALDESYWSITHAWPETLALNIPVGTVPEVLAKRKTSLPPGSRGYVLVLPSDQDGPDTVGLSRAWAVVVDSDGPHLVDVRGENVTWPNYVQDRGDVMMVLIGPDATTLIGRPPPLGLDFAHHFHLAFQEAFGAASGSEPDRWSVVVPQAFRPGQAGLQEILQLAKNGGKGTSGWVHIFSPKLQKHWVSNLVVANDDSAVLIDHVDRDAPEDDAVVSAIVVAPDRTTLLAGHEKESVETGPEPAGQLPSAARAPRRMIEVLGRNEVLHEEVLQELVFQQETNQSSLPTHLKFAGKGMEAIAKLFVQLQFRTKPGDAALLSTDSFRIAYLQSNGPERSVRHHGIPSFIMDVPAGNVGPVFVALLSNREDTKHFLHWAGTNWHAARPRWFRPPKELLASQIVETNMESYAGETAEAQAAYEAFLSHPGRPYIAAAGLGYRAIAAASTLRNHNRAASYLLSANDVFDRFVNDIINPSLAGRRYYPAPTPLLRDIRHLTTALDFYTETVKRLRTPGSAASPDLNTVFPEPFGKGKAGLRAVINLARAGRRGRTGDARPGPGTAQEHAAHGTALVVITRSPSREYEAYVVFNESGHLLLKTSSGVRVATPDALGNDSTIYALGTGPDWTTIAGVPRSRPTGDTSNPQAGRQYQAGIRGGAGSPAELETDADDDASWEIGSVSDQQTVSDNDADFPGLVAAMAELSTWYGHPATPETVDLDASEGPVAQALSQLPEPAGNGFTGLARVRDSLPTSGGAALLAVSEPTARMVIVFRSRGQIELVDHVHGTRLDLTAGNIHPVGAALGEIHAALFDTDQRPVPLIPLDDYQMALYDEEERGHQLRDDVAAGRDIHLPGTVGRVVSWSGRMYLLTKKVLLPELAADVAAALDREIVALVVGADAEDPIRWMLFPSLGQPVPVKPEDLPPEAQAALAELSGPGKA